MKLFNATAVEDLVVREHPIKGRYVGGAVTNWTLVSLNHDTQMCMDPNVRPKATPHHNVLTYGPHALCFTLVPYTHYKYLHTLLCTLKSTGIVHHVLIVDVYTQVLECKVMVSSTGHDGPMGASGVKRLAKLGMITGAPGMGALDMNTAEDAVVRTHSLSTSFLSANIVGLNSIHIEMYHLVRSECTLWPWFDGLMIANPFMYTHRCDTHVRWCPVWSSAVWRWLSSMVPHEWAPPSVPCSSPDRRLHTAPSTPSRGKI